MNGAVIRNVIVTILLVIVAFVIGSEAAEDSKGAVLIVGSLVSLFVFIVLGKNCWWLLFVLPPIVSQFPIGVVQTLPVEYSVAAAVLIYWLVMFFIGRVSFTWRSVWWLDGLLAVFAVYFACTYYWHPVSLGMFADEDTEVIGGKEYVWGIAAVLYYVILSCIPCTWPQLLKVFKVLLVITSGLTLFYTASDADASAIKQTATTTRFGLFVGLGLLMVKFILARYPITQVVISPWKLLTLAGGAVGVMLSGFRENLMFIVMYCGLASYTYKRLTALFCLVLSGYAALLYLGSEDKLEELPFGVQRCLRLLPGVKVSEQAARDADGSANWRVVMWKWALDPRTGYIRDYWFGDGFGQSMTMMRRWTVQLNRGRQNGGDQEFFADTGVWHSGPITAIHRAGIVGLVLMSVFWMGSLLLLLRTCALMRNQKSIFYILFLTMNLPADVVGFYLSAGTFKTFFRSFATISLVKIIYVEAQRAGIVSSSRAGVYIPMTVRELENAKARGQKYLTAS